MEYDSQYSKENNTHSIKLTTRNSKNVKSFKISKEKYRDSRRVVKRMYK